MFLLLSMMLMAQDLPPFYEDKAHLLSYQAPAGESHAVRTREDWALRRRHILENFQQVAGPMPGEDRRVPLDLRVEEETATPKYLRRRISFAVEAGDRLPAWLLLPLKRADKAPAVLCLHPTHPRGKDVVVIPGLEANRDYAHELAERGFVALAPDYPGFGDYKIDAYAMGYASATMKGIWNHRRCVDLLQSLPEVDPERIGCIGHSLGGHNTLFAGLFDERIKAMVSSCGFCSFPTYYQGNLTGWTHKGYMPRIDTTYHKDPKKMPFDFTEVLAALAPRPLFVNAPLHDDNFDAGGVRDCLQAAQPVYALFNAAERLTALHPDCGHDFPPEARNAAYAVLDAALRPQ